MTCPLLILDGGTGREHVAALSALRGQGRA